MPRIVELTVLALLIAAPTIAFQNQRRARSQRNRAPTIQSFESSKSVVDLCPFAPGGSCSSGTSVVLEVKAIDPDNDNLSYKYSISKGAIVGSGPAVNWDLTKAFGTQTAKVEVTDQRGGKATSIVQVDVVECSTCDPPCPYLRVTCPTNISEGEIASFEASVSVDPDSQKLIYLWSHSNGKLIPGQEATKLRIKAIGLPGDVITATVRVLGLDPACNHQASCESTIAKRVQ